MSFREPKIVSQFVIMIFLAFMMIGVVTFIVRASGDHPEKAWQAYLINFLLFSAIARGGLLLPIVMNTSARWSRLLSGVSESFAAFFRVSFVLFLILFLGRTHVFPMAWDEAPRKGSLAELPLHIFPGAYRNIYSIWIGVRLSFMPLGSSCPTVGRSGLSGLLGRRWQQQQLSGLSQISPQ